MLRLRKHYFRTYLKLLKIIQTIFSIIKTKFYLRAITSISTRAFLGSCLTATQLRAGKLIK